MTTIVDIKTVDFQVRRDDLRHRRFVDGTAPALEEGQALLKVDRFALTANNITYAAFGDLMNYWGFFPAPEGWGRVPVWGFADVVESRCAGVEPGQRFYGYYPMSTHLVVDPVRVSEAGFTDGAAHRQALHGVYNNYSNVARDPGYDPAFEAQQMLLRPLFTTSFVLDDFAADNGFFGAKAVVLTSASSKTAFGLAFLLHSNRRDDVEIIGLTSPGNIAFVEGLGCYDRVIAYDDVTSLPADVPAMYVDMAGNGAVLEAMHHHYGDNLKYACLVGGTHWEKRAGLEGLPGAKPEGFFAPDQIKKRVAEWGNDGLQARIAEAWRAFLEPVTGWITVKTVTGPAAAEQVYLDMLEGTAAPDIGYVVSLHEED